MKRRLILIIPALFLLSMMQSSCDLFSEIEHCKFETIDTKYWLPERDPALGFVSFSPNNPFLDFGFARVIPLLERSLKVENICPFGFFNVVVKILEKKMLNPSPQFECLIYTEQKKIPVLKSDFIIKWDHELGYQGIASLVLNDLIDSGPDTYYVRIMAHFNKGDFANDLAMEQWAKDNVSKIAIAMKYVRWE